MKNIFFLKLGIGILAVFGLLIGGFVFWKPINVTYYKYQLGSDNPETHAAAVKYLLEADAIEPVKYYYENRYASNDVNVRLAVVDELCEFGDKGKELMREIFRNRCKREMVSIPAGSFMMGSENGNGDEKPVHKVTLSAFWMDKYEVTNEKYYVFVKSANHRLPNHWKSGRIPAGWEPHPVVYVSWEDGDAYAKWLKMRLPTEAEWEYACRAGSTTEYYFGDNTDKFEEYVCSNSKHGECITNPVGTKKPNKWGLYNMHDNVYEYCADWYGSDYYANSPTNNPHGPLKGNERVMRGGCWFYDYGCRSALRSWLDPNIGQEYVGFRVSRFGP
jgi:formylglycine-generating enzyme required for sulfatase activity